MLSVVGFIIHRFINKWCRIIEWLMGDTNSPVSHDAHAAPNRPEWVWRPAWGSWCGCGLDRPFPTHNLLPVWRFNLVPNPPPVWPKSPPPKIVNISSNSAVFFTSVKELCAMTEKPERDLIYSFSNDQHSIGRLRAHLNQMIQNWFSVNVHS